MTAAGRSNMADGRLPFSKRLTSWKVCRAGGKTFHACVPVTLELLGCTGW